MLQTNSPKNSKSKISIIEKNEKFGLEAST